MGAASSSTSSTRLRAPSTRYICPSCTSDRTSAPRAACTREIGSGCSATQTWGNDSTPPRFLRRKQERATRRSTIGWAWPQRHPPSEPRVVQWILVGYIDGGLGRGTRRHGLCPFFPERDRDSPRRIVAV